MSYVVTMIQPDRSPRTLPEVRSFGPYKTREDAERVRRRIHFDHGRGMFNRTRTFVSELEQEKR